MARYPSGIVPLPGRGVSDARARAAQMAIEDGLSPVGTTAPCMNPECAGPVDYLGHGSGAFYCSTYCRNRASELRILVAQQLEELETTLAETKQKTQIPREQLQQRVRQLQWWRARLGTFDAT